MTLLYWIQHHIPKCCRITLACSSAIALPLFTAIATSVPYSMARWPEQDKRPDQQFPPATIAPCPGRDCSHHYQSTTLTGHIREMEARRRQQIDGARFQSEQLSREMMARSQSKMNEHLNKFVEQNQLRDQQIAKTVGMATAVYPLWNPEPAEVQGIYTMRGWNDTGPVVMTGKGMNQKVPVVLARLAGGGREVPLHYTALYDQLRFIRFAAIKEDIFHVYREKSVQEIEQAIVSTRRVPQEPGPYKIELPQAGHRCREFIAVLPDPNYQSVKRAVHIIFSIP